MECHAPRVAGRPPNENYSELGRGIAYWLPRRNMSREALAEAVGTDEGNLSRWMRGQEPGYAAVVRIARELRVSVETLLRPRPVSVWELDDEEARLVLTFRGVNAHAKSAVNQILAEAEDE